MQEVAEIANEGENEFEVVYDEEYDPEREKQLELQLSQETGGLSAYWAENFSKNAGKYWHDFYKHNGNRFFKDRHYLDIVFSELNALENNGNANVSLLEVGCGVGNAFFPLCTKYPNLHVYACDFAKSAVEIIHNNEMYDTNRMHVWQADLVKDEIIEHIPEGGCDLLLIMFVLSAVNPKNMDLFMEHAVKGLKQGGMLMFRDYGRYDMAQIRFKPTRKIEANLYARQDGTLAYFFDIEELDELFKKHGLEKVESKYLRRCIRNRKTNKEMHRTLTKMTEEYNWMYSKEVLKSTNNKQDSTNVQMISQPVGTYLETKQIIPPSINVNFAQQVMTNVNEELVKTDIPTNSTPLEAPKENTPVEPVTIKKEVVSEENEEKSAEMKEVENKEDSVKENKIERKCPIHFIKASEKRDEENENHFVDPETGERWIRCQNPFCGKWRFVPKNVEMPTISPWYCVLNTWDEEVASCTYPQLYDSVIITKKKEPPKAWLPTRECHFKRIELC